MGAASIMMSSELGLPENVKGLIADCGYSEPAAIIMATIRAMKLPVKPLYQLIKCSAQLFGRFDLESAAPLRAVSQSNIPILFIHGAQDSIVPVSMGEELYRACISKKEKVFIEGADHTVSFPVVLSYWHKKPVFPANKLRASCRFILPPCLLKV